ncbi:Malic enzyme, NAD-binding protein [Metarhizium album ARSEF 1941]|uniref:Malic enzyme n=1 Tax=Metarhizium album (strain ARSEF 1941) TaxID=1081103 RepID=A0A0B2WLR5_METAS|nr:Malic enzyme, NAD-binding protein [Metarhizium album ARSEF 1941]KHN93960.1 Malic enzyme, NAD-binding protein [Metarhizium album ARSEF 1941]
MASGNDQSQFDHLALNATGPIPCALQGQAVLNTPYFNKGSAFPGHERRLFNLTGLLPQNVQTLEEQAQRAREQYLSQANDLAKNTFLASLKEQNEVLYYKASLLQDNLKAMFSVVYTPTEGEAIQNYSRLFRRPEGCFLNINDAERVSHDLAMWGESEDIDYIVVTDGEEILGIGDQGVGGVLISVAKLVLATLCAGVHPSRCLPVVLDCGTDNEDLLRDQLYLGLRERRVRGRRYDAFVDAFVRAARRLYPRAYIHFEDFGLQNGKSRRILDTYRPRMACFNDDVQGTGCVTLAAIMAGLHVSGQQLADLKMVVFGAGSAGLGIADQVRDAVAAEGGTSHEEASKQIWLVDRRGLVTSETVSSAAQKPFAKNASDWTGQGTDLLSVTKAVCPNVLVGTSTVPGAFTQQVVAAMAEHTPRPIILPLSNPTRLHEQTPRHLLQWTRGKALVATGSPFDPVEGPWGPGGEQVTVEIAECNNSVVFPGIGLGCILSRARLLTDKMLVAAVQAVAAMSPALENPTAPLLPDVSAVREVSLQVARGVIRAAVEEGVATEAHIPRDDARLREWIKVQMWEPRYRDLQKVQPEGAGRGARGEARKAGTVDRRPDM